MVYLGTCTTRDRLPDKWCFYRMTEIKVLFFATLRDRVGLREAQLELPEKTAVKELKLLLAERFPGISESLPTVLVAVNREFAFDADLVPDGAEVALFPPVSGGS